MVAVKPRFGRPISSLAGDLSLAITYNIVYTYIIGKKPKTYDTPHKIPIICFYRAKRVYIRIEIQKLQPFCQ